MHSCNTNLEEASCLAHDANHLFSSLRYRITLKPRATVIAANAASAGMVNIAGNSRRTASRPPKKSFTVPFRLVTRFFPKSNENETSGEWETVQPANEGRSNCTNRQ